MKGKRATIILFAGVMQIFSHCQEEFRTVELSENEPGADIHIHKFRREKIRESGEREWYMKAEEAYLYGGAGAADSRIAVYDFTLDQYGSDGTLQGTVQAEKGEVDYENQTVRLKGKVIYKESPVKSIEATSMVYNMDTKILKSEEKVIIREEGLTTVCRSGIVVEREKERQVCKNPAGVARSVQSDPGNESTGEAPSPVEGIFH